MLLLVYLGNVRGTGIVFDFSDYIHPWVAVRKNSGKEMHLKNPKVIPLRFDRKINFVFADLHVRGTPEWCARALGVTTPRPICLHAGLTG